ncbi:MAG: phosphoribosylformylglycinamidine synthase [Clostridia bacterium]
MNHVKRIFVEKKQDYAIEAESCFRQFRDFLGIRGIKGVRIVFRYDISGISADVFQKAKDTIFSEPPVDRVTEETLPLGEGMTAFAVEYLPGQYDMRADSCVQCIRLLDKDANPVVRTATVYILSGDLSGEEIARIKDYVVNPVESREAEWSKPKTLETAFFAPASVRMLHGFREMDEKGRSAFMEEAGLAMNMEDLAFIQEYFQSEDRDPTVTEIRVIDTYWSDHCRHTTFLTCIDRVEMEQSPYLEHCRQAHREYLEARTSLYGGQNKCVTLMDIATIAAKELKKQGLLTDLEESEENNACSIVVEAEVDGETEEWLVMFKNETHNHPTEIEPFGGAATCLGGAIRDPLSGRAYVYQAMRLTGAGDPGEDFSKTLPGKLPQMKITREAAHGYSSYGNQVGVATGYVDEVYDEGFLAKRMEIGAVIAAAPRRNVTRLSPQEGDVVLLLGGRTGRDGCGGATGSSKKHDEESLAACGAEVQKGNPPTERKIQRLFRNQKASLMIKKCNDFGAGGVCVAIGELAPGIHIDLDKVPRKYEGLDGTELAISESQERMAVVLAPEDVEAFIRLAGEENLEATLVATVTGQNRIIMEWRGTTIVDISRDFLDTNGITQHVEALVKAPGNPSYFERPAAGLDWEARWKNGLGSIHACSRKGLVERFDSTIGAGSILMPFGGKTQMSPQEGMAAKLPVEKGETGTATLMACGYNPRIGKWSPFHGACYAVLESMARIAAMGGDVKRIRFTFQEYFQRLSGRESWGKPLAALLGAYHAQKRTGLPSIGGKDSMSGTFKDRHVPPTLVSFAVCPGKAGEVISAEFKEAGNTVVLARIPCSGDHVPNFEEAMEIYGTFRRLVEQGIIVSASSVKEGGIAEAVSKMCFGNMLGFAAREGLSPEECLRPLYGCIVAEARGETPFEAIGTISEKPAVELAGRTLDLKDLLDHWEAGLESVFPTGAGQPCSKSVEKIFYGSIAVRKGGWGKPRVFIPVFPGTNCETDTRAAFEKAGAACVLEIFRNLNSTDIGESIRRYAAAIRKSQILMLPGGFSAGDEPEGSGKFIATVFRNPLVAMEVLDMLENRDGLVLGICNGFQALIKLGLLPYGEIRDMREDSPTLTFNRIGRHVSRMVDTKVVSDLSPWLSLAAPGTVYTVPVSHGEGRFVCSPEEFLSLLDQGQIATQYVDMGHIPGDNPRYNPNGSYMAVEGITSPDGRVFGKMGHSERMGRHVCVNVPGEKDMRIFEAGVRYFE